MGLDQVGGLEEGLVQEELVSVQVELGLEREQVGWGLVREELESAPEPEHRLHCHNQTESMLSVP
jgi:hypothetical protein